MRVCFQALVMTVLGLIASSALAQFQQYTPPGSLAQPSKPQKATLEQAMAEARWRLGPLRLDPWFAVKDVTLVDRALVLDLTGEQESDFTATVGAGLQAYLPVGSKLIWSTWALPEYVWWKDIEDRRRLNGRYGTGLFAEFSRMSFDLSASRNDSSQIVTPEFPQRINARQDLATAALEIELSSAVALFADAGTIRFRHLLDEEPGDGVPPFNNLDRDEDVVRVGLRYSPSGRLQIGVGIEDSQADFGPSAIDRSNSGSGPVLEFLYRGPRFRFSLDAADRSLEPTAGSEFVPYDQRTGRVELGLNPDSPLGVDFYGSRNLGYSLTQAYSVFDSERLGLAVELRREQSIRLRLFGEEGTDDFVLVAAAPDRRDDVRSYGADFLFELRPRATLRLSGYRTEYDSDLPAFDRELTEVSLSLTLGKIAIVAR